MTFDNNQFMMEWLYKKNWTFILCTSSTRLPACLAWLCVHHHIECWSLIAFLCKFFSPLLSVVCTFSTLPEIKCSCYLCYWPIYRHLFSYALCLALGFFSCSLNLFLFTSSEKNNKKKGMDIYWKRNG